LHMEVAGKIIILLPARLLAFKKKLHLLLEHARWKRFLKPSIE